MKTYNQFASHLDQSGYFYIRAYDSMQASMRADKLLKQKLQLKHDRYIRSRERSYANLNG